MFNQLFLSVFSAIEDSISKITTAIIILMIVGVIVYSFIKFDKFRVFLGYFLVLVLMIGGVFSGYHLNKYYNMKGGIVGQLTEIFNPNVVDVNAADEDIIFDFSSVMMTQIEGSKYRAEFITDDFIELETDEAYVVFVNDAPCELIEYGENLESDLISSDYVISEYYYAFYDENKDFVLKDTLTFRFAFYKNSTRLIVETTGGEEAVSLWNSYFQKNDFIVKIKAQKNVYIATFANINIKINDEIVETLSLKKGSVYVLPETYVKSGFRFMGWSFDGKTITSETKINLIEDIDIYAIFEKLYYVNYCYLNDSTIDQNSNIYSVQSYILGETFDVSVPENPSKNHFIFEGWSLDGETVVDLNTIINDGTISVVYAVWSPKQITLNINLDGGSFVLDGDSYSDIFELSFVADEKIILSEPLKDGYVFANYVISHSTLDYYTTTSEPTLFMTVEEIYYLIYGSELNLPQFDSSNESNFEIISLNVKVQYNPTADNIDYWSDDDLKDYIEFNLGINYSEDGYVYTSVENETWIKTIFYEQVIGDDSTGKTLFEIETEIVELLELDAQITEQTTTREFIELLYYYTKNYIEE